MAKKLPEITLYSNDIYSPPAKCGRATARWTDDADNRYHAHLVKVDGRWQIDVGTTRKQPTVYKNPPEGVGRDDPQHFAPRLLSPETAANRAVVREALRLANETSAIRDDAEACHAERMREQAMERHKDAAAVRDAFNRALADSFAAGEIDRNKFTGLIDLTHGLPDESWLTLARAVRKA
jgi:hypothetical protein